MQQGLILHADETSWWQNNVKHWLWVAATSLVTVFMINRHRGKQAARQLLGAFEGVLITDRWQPYRVHGSLRQFCWAHLERDFKGFAEMKGEASRKGSLFVERILPVHATCNLQSRNTFSYLVDACVARLNHLPAPSPAAFSRLGLLNAYAHDYTECKPPVKPKFV